MRYCGAGAAGPVSLFVSAERTETKDVVADLLPRDSVGRGVDVARAAGGR
jgi:hypothetical protein